MDETHTVHKLMLICIDGHLLGVGVGLFTHVRRWPSVCVGVSLFQWPPACLLLCCVWLGLAGTRNYSGMQGQGVNRHSRVTRNDSTCKTPFNFHHSSIPFWLCALYILNASFISTHIKAVANMQHKHLKHSDQGCTMQTMHILNQFQAM